MAAVGRTSYRVAFLTAETERCQVGGLAEVARALPNRLREQGAQIVRLAPLHSVVWQHAGPHLKEVKLQRPVSVTWGTEEIPICVFEDTSASVPTFYFGDAVDALSSRFFSSRKVYPQDESLGAQFIFATRASLELLASGQFGDVDVVHFQDWHFALAGTLIRLVEKYSSLRRAGIVGTIHNAFSWPLTPEEFTNMTALKQDDHAHLFDWPHGLWHEGSMHILKAIADAHAVNTVSLTYARELQTTLGFSFDGFFRHLAAQGRFRGILNGIDPRWDPATDNVIASPFSPDNVNPKARSKEALQRAFGLKEDPALPLVTLLSRLTPQKGLDLVFAQIPRFVGEGVQFVISGSGDEIYTTAARDLAKRFPGMVGVRLDSYDDTTPHLVYAGGDIFVRASYYEPCGQSQLIAMRYGNIPVVHSTGGLADTVFDMDDRPANANGFAFREYTPHAYAERLGRAIQVFRHDATDWQTLMQRGMRGDYSWDKPADQYLGLYEGAVRQARLG